jgi:hypothetical protein
MLWYDRCLVVVACGCSTLCLLGGVLLVSIASTFPQLLGGIGAVISGVLLVVPMLGSSK